MKAVEPKCMADMGAGAGLVAIEKLNMVVGGHLLTSEDLAVMDDKARMAMLNHLSIMTNTPLLWRDNGSSVLFPALLEFHN